MDIVDVRPEDLAKEALKELQASEVPERLQLPSLTPADLERLRDNFARGRVIIMRVPPNPCSECGSSHVTLKWRRDQHDFAKVCLVCENVDYV